MLTSLLIRKDILMKLKQLEMFPELGLERISLLKEINTKYYQTRDNRINKVTDIHEHLTDGRIIKSQHSEFLGVK
jgi:hypothetical protein